MEKKRVGFFQRFLNFVENTGNRLPHPVTLFAVLAFLVVIISAVVSYFGVSAEHPGKAGEIIEVKNLLSTDGIKYIFTEMTNNFAGFAPLGVVLVTMLGIGLAEGTGLISAMLRGFVLSVPKRLITLGLVFAGVDRKSVV